MFRVSSRTSNSKLLLLIFLYTYSEVIHTFFFHLEIYIYKNEISFFKDENLQKSRKMYEYKNVWIMNENV